MAKRRVAASATAKTRRGRRSSPGTLNERPVQTAPRVIKSFQDKIEELARFAGTNKNVHKEVKLMSMDLRRLAAQSEMDFTLLHANNRELKEALEKRSEDAKKVSRDNGCQTDLAESAKAELNL